MERHQENAMKFAEHLEKHQKVKQVLYPGLPSHPQHEIAKKQMKGFSGMVSVLFNMSDDEVKEAMTKQKVIILAESLGAVESLMQIPAAMSNNKIPKELREKHGLTEGLCRFSIGIENIEDIIADIDQAIA